MLAKYAYSLNGEHYTGAYPAREDALADAIDAARLSSDSPGTVYVGRIVPTDAKASGHARAVIASMASRAREQFGDAASGYLTGLSRDQIEELDDRLAMTILAWLDRNELAPTFTRVDAIGEHQVPPPSAQRTNEEEEREVQVIGSGPYGM